MSFGTNNLILDVLSVLVALVAAAVVYLKWSFTYWERKGVKQIMKPSIPLGHMNYFFSGARSPGEQFVHIYKTCRANNLKHCGLFMITKPVYVPIDPELIKNIMQKDFDHFVNHGIYANEEKDPLTGHLFNLKDAKWRDMRVKLTPTFTSGKMKMMFQTLAECGDVLKHLIDEYADTNKPVDIKEALGRFSTDIIGSCAFGLDINSLTNPDSDFRKYGKKVFEVNVKQVIKRLAFFSLPEGLIKKIGVKFTDKDVEKFFMDVVKKTVEYREQNQVYRKDFMHLLLQLKNIGKVTEDGTVTDENVQVKALTIEEVAAQAFVFFLAGFETSSTTMTWALFELALNPDVQTELRKEINVVLAKHDGKLTYDAIVEMTYLDKVIKETLRKYPALPILMRVCTKDYKVPNSDLVIEKGTQVRIPVLGLQTDPDYYPDPDKFSPERFSEEEKNKRPAFTYLPFGDGPRICIGMRFGLMQTKVGVITLVKNFNIKLNNKTSLPVVFQKGNIFPVAKDGVWLDIEKIGH